MEDKEKIDAGFSAMVEKEQAELEQAVKEYFRGHWPDTTTAEGCNTQMSFTPPAIMRLAEHFYERGRKQVLQEIYEGKVKPVDEITAAWLDD